MSRWIVDTGDGHAVAEDTPDGPRIVTALDLSFPACERAITKLRAADAKRVAKTRQQAGERLARHNRKAV